jgi:ABC-type sugar transport system ATPase subunit
MLDGAPAHFKNVSEAHRAGIVTLYQELSIVPNITVAKNILLGNEAPSRGGVVDWVRLRRVAREQLKRLDQEHIPVNKMAGGLTPVQQTMVAIARAIAVKARVLIMDEPTAALTDLEIKSLFNILRKLRDEGVAIIYVSHRLEEVFALRSRHDHAQRTSDNHLEGRRHHHRRSHLHHGRPQLAEAVPRQRPSR